VEALDELNEVIAEHPTHHSAYAGRARALWFAFMHLSGHAGLLGSAYLDYERAIELSGDSPVFRRSYQSSLAGLQKQTRKPVLTARPATESEQWIWKQGLALNLCPCCRVQTPNAFDVYLLRGRLVAPRRRPSSDELLELLNTLHRTFSAARWCLLHAAGVGGGLPTDQVVTLEGLSGARHELPVGLTITAISGFYSVLDKVAFALNSYLHMGHADAALHLNTVWSALGWKRQRGQGRIPEKRVELHPAIRRTTTRPLLGLYHLALSLERGLGMYQHLRDLRNQLEHRVVVATSQPVASRYFQTVDVNDLHRRAVLMGRVAKAAMWYFGGTVWWLEYQRHKRTKT
jgi:LA2681-like HEPN